MTRDEAVARIQQGCGWRSDVVDQIAYALREAQRLIEIGRSLPYFLVEEDEDLSAPTGSAAIALPDRFIREYDENDRSTLRYYDSTAQTWVFLEKMDHDDALVEFASMDAGTPQAYVLRKDTIEIFPERDQDYTLVWSYYKGGEVLSSNIENSWLANAPDVLIGKAGASIATDLENDKAVGIFNALYKEAWAGAFAADILRQEANRDRAVGGRL